MSVDLRIYGIRKLRDAEIKELTGKTIDEIYESKFFRELFPSASSYSRYMFCDRPDGSMKSIAHMLTPIETADEDIVYVYWEEELGYYWKNLSHDDPTIDMILDDVRRYIGYIDWDQSYNVVPSGCIGSYFNKQYPTGNDSEEIIAISYG